MNYEQFKERIQQVINEQEAAFMDYNNDVFDHPELSGKEYETSKKIVNLLEKYGYNVEYPFMDMDTAMRGIYGDNNHKYKIALMVEYDALPEVGHACGHCLSGAISMLAGVALKELQDELNADIHIIGTPEEETNGKKVEMSDKGLFDSYDYAIMVHLYNENIISPKLQCLAGRYFEFFGKSSHASAAPWDGINALNAGQLFFHAIDMNRQHSLPGTQFHGIFHNGGAAPNIVPEHVVIEEYVRAGDKDVMYDALDRIMKCAEGASIATGTTWKCYQVDADYYNMKPNKTGEDALTEVYNELGLPILEVQETAFGSADAGNVSWRCPAFHPTLKISDAAIHTREFADVMKTETAHQALITGAKIITYSIVKIFSDESKIEQMKKDFNGR